MADQFFVTSQCREYLLVYWVKLKTLHSISFTEKDLLSNIVSYCTSPFSVYLWYNRK